MRRAKVRQMAQNRPIMANAAQNRMLQSVDAASEQFAGVITKTEKAIFDSAVELIKRLDIDANGYIKNTTANLKLLSDIKTRLARIANNKDYLRGVKDLAQAFDDIYRKQLAYYSQSFAAKTLGENHKSKFAAMQRVAVSNTVEGLTGAGLQTGVLDSLNKMLLKAVTSGAKYSDLVADCKAQLISTGDSQSSLAKYAGTYATTAMTQYAGQNNKLFTDDLGTEWFEYVGSTIETMREFCNVIIEHHPYIHKSEIPDILKGEIVSQKTGEVIHVALNPKTGLPKGMIEDTTPENFQINVGGWNCRHQLVPIAKEAVPKEIRERIETPKTPDGKDADISEWESWYFDYKSYIDDLAHNAAICGIAHGFFDKTHDRTWYMKEYVRVDNAVKNKRETYNDTFRDLLILGSDARNVSDALANDIYNFAAQHQFEAIGVGQYQTHFQALLTGYKNFEKALIAAKKASAGTNTDIDSPLTQEEIQNGCIAPTKVQKEKLLKIASDLGIKLKRAMSREDADKGRENPQYSQSGEYHVNCQTCTMVHLARRMGLDVEAVGNKKDSVYKYMSSVGMTWKERFLNPDGTPPKYIKARTWSVQQGHGKVTKEVIRSFIDANTQSDGIYEIYCAWKHGSAHVFCVERANGKLRYFDPQSGKEGTYVEAYIEQMKGSSVEILRIDDKIINPKCGKLFVVK